MLYQLSYPGRAGYCRALAAFVNPAHCLIGNLLAAACQPTRSLRIRIALQRLREPQPSRACCRQASKARPRRREQEMPPDASPCPRTCAKQPEQHPAEPSPPSRVLYPIQDTQYQPGPQAQPAGNQGVRCWRQNLEPRQGNCPPNSIVNRSPWCRTDPFLRGPAPGLTSGLAGPLHQRSSARLSLGRSCGSLCGSSGSPRWCADSRCPVRFWQSTPGCSCESMTAACPAADSLGPARLVPATNGSVPYSRQTRGGLWRERRKDKGSTVGVRQPRTATDRKALTS